MSPAEDSPPRAWHIITSEYPPTVGGVSDHTYAVAASLARLHPVHVWCPPMSDAPSKADGVVVHATLSTFSPKHLRQLGAALDRQQRPRRVFVQWVPQGFGYRSLNVGFAAWLAWRAWKKGDQIHMMVHEPFLPWSVKPARFVAAFVHRVMLVLATRRATRIWLSTPSWEPLVRRFVPRGTPLAWLPVTASTRSTREPSSLSGRHPHGPLTVGHFGTYSPLVTSILAPAIDTVLEGSTASILLVGRGSDIFGTRYVRDHPEAVDRVRATGELSGDAIGPVLCSCDVMMQPYPDGVTARRTSTLTLLALGLPVVTNHGVLSEAFWGDSRSVALVNAPSGRHIGQETVGLLADARRRRTLGARGSEFYERQFDVRHSVALLESTESVGPNAA